MPSSKQPPRRSVLIAARVITAAVALAGAEGVLWFGGYPAWWQQLAMHGDQSEFQGDPELGWINRKGQFDLVWPDGKNPFHYTNWSHGQRATGPREPAQNDGRPRVLFFGDSYVYGYGLSDAQTFPWMIQLRYAELNVSNYGTPDYGTYQSYLSMKRVLSVRRPAPQATSVFYLFNGFHEERNVGERNWIRVVKEPPPGWSFPYAEVSKGVLLAERSPGERMWPLSRHLRLVAMAQEYDQIARSYLRVRNKRQVTEMLLVKMDEVARSADAKFNVILFDFDPKERQQYRAFLSSHGIGFVDCDHPELNDKSLRLSDGHPNEKLNRLLAGWVEPVPLISALAETPRTHPAR